MIHNDWSPHDKKTQILPLLWNSVWQILHKSSDDNLQISWYFFWRLKTFSVTKKEQLSDGFWFSQDNVTLRTRSWGIKYPKFKLKFHFVALFTIETFHYNCHCPQTNQLLKWLWISHTFKWISGCATKYRYTGKFVLVLSYLLDVFPGNILRLFCGLFCVLRTKTIELQPNGGKYARIKFA